MRLLVLSCCLLLIHCKPGYKSIEEINGTYYGYWALTGWSWSFSDTRFVLQSPRQMKEARGNFELRNDSLFIQFLQDDIRPLGIGINRMDTLVVFKERCLISLRDGYDYCKQDPDKPGEYHNSTKRK